MQRDGDQQRLLDEEQQQQQEAEEQQDEPMLGSEQRGFVPAFSPQYDVDDDERCLLVRERDRDEVVQLTNAPSAGAALTYCVFYLLGIGTMTPWNFFVTAEDYWKYKFRNTTLNGTHPEEELTPLQKSFACDLALTATISGTTFLLLNAVYGHYVSLRAKMLGTLCTILVLFGVTTGFVEVDTDRWQEQFFLITLIIVVILNISSATMSGALYGVAGLFPSEYMTAVVSGQALGGILTALAFILVLAFDAGPSATAFVFFIMGALLIFFCIVCYSVMARQAYFKYYLDGGDKFKVISALPSHSRSDESGVPLEPILKQVLGKIYMQAVCLALLYATTLSVYPSVTVLMQSENSASHTEWSDVYYLPVVNYLFFNCGDYFGRLTAGWLECPRSQQTTLLWTVVRVLFVPCFLCSNSSEHHFLPTLVQHDYTFMAMIIAFALSNGYLTNILLIMAPRSVDQHEKELAASIMAASLSVGMAVGLLLSLAFVQML
ncbi:equilibrative nucleoside transporter 2 [Drosophila novamexicana]|uniref:equilibrative nucleoside transporter 2 n=1 Tax=Drosophila novamexicana TaxID=47314 RepID=UPI0011E59112|nr:equilibrative nucleoside transporter 2 [Drosophila novamexicana]